MNNKKGGFGAKFVLVLLLMIASAVGGAYAYRVFDGKIAVRDAKNAIADVDISDYDEPEQVVIQNYIDDATKDLEKVKTRKEVYEVLGEFISDVDKVQTKNEKALEEALKAAEEAKKENESNEDSSLFNRNNGNNDTEQPTYDSNNSGDSDNGGSYKSNQLKSGSDEAEEGGSGILDSLLGSMKGK